MQLGLLATTPLGFAACDKPESTRLETKPLPHVRVANVTWVQPRPQSTHLAPLVPLRRARLSPRTGGQVVSIKVDEEERVEAGKVMVRFAADDPRGGLMSAKASIERIDESLRDTQRELDDARELVAGGVGTTREVERLESQQATLKAQLREARGGLVRAKDRVGAATIEAPFDATVTKVDTEVGEYIAPGAVAVVLAQLDPIAVEVPLTQPEVELSDADGLSFKVTARGREVDSKLEWVASESEQGNATFIARLQIPNPKRTLRAGELVDVQVFGAAKERVMAVPFTAVRWAAEQAYVLRVQNTTLERVDVMVVDESDELVVIEGKLAVGDAVVSTGPIALLPGDEVSVVDPPSDTIARGK